MQPDTQLAQSPHHVAVVLQTHLPPCPTSLLALWCQHGGDYLVQEKRLYRGWECAPATTLTLTTTAAATGIGAARSTACKPRQGSQK